MAAPIRMTLAVATVLGIFASDPGQQRYGYQLMEATGFASGKLYPILARLEAAGWLDRLPPVHEAGPHRAPRVPYRINAAALPMIEQELSKVAASVSPIARLRPGGSQV